VGAARRRPARLIMVELEMNPPLDEREFWRAKQALLQSGLEIATEDAGENPGIWIATCPDDLDVTIYRMDFRLHGILDTLNHLLQIRRGRWPLDKFPPKPERALRSGPAFHLPSGYEPAGREPRKPRGVNRHIGREAQRLEAGGAPTPAREVWAYKCTECEEVVWRATSPEEAERLILTHRENRECLGKLKLAEPVSS
jgi:hypothetical protein